MTQAKEIFRKNPKIRNTYPTKYIYRVVVEEYPYSMKNIDVVVAKHKPKCITFHLLNSFLWWEMRLRFFRIQLWQVNAITIIAPGEQ